MEKFFIITDECKFKGKYLEYKESCKNINEYLNEFFKENNIESSQYYLGNKQLFICPSENDLKLFSKELNKPIEYGLRGFKKNGKINKSFLNGLKEKDLKIQYKPNLCMYINFLGKLWTTTFIKNNVMYAKIETENYCEIKSKGFVEIKASEYYKVQEEEM